MNASRPGFGPWLPSARAQLHNLSRAGQPAKAAHVIRRPPKREPMGAARIVADHASDGAPSGRGRIRPEPKPVDAGSPLQVTEDDAGLDHRRPVLRIDADDLVHEPAEVQHQSGSHGVAGARRAGTAACDSQSVPAGNPDRLDHVVRVLGHDYHLGHYPVVRGVRGIFRASTGAAVNDARNGCGEFFDNLVNVHAWCSSLSLRRCVVGG